MKIKPKNEAAITQMRRAGIVMGAVKAKLRAALRPGISTLELDAIAEAAIRAAGATPAFKNYNGFPATLCVSVNAEMIHGVPRATRILQANDVVKIDGGAIVAGYYSDTAFTAIVPGGTPDAISLKIMVAAEAAFAAGVAALRPGARLGDVEAAIGASIAASGFYPALEYTGHGIGRALHEPPAVRNYGVPNTGPRIVVGTTLAIEPMLLQTNAGTLVGADQWTVSARDGRVTAHYEETVLVTATGNEILTKELT